MAITDELFHAIHEHYALCVDKADQMNSLARALDRAGNPTVAAEVSASALAVRRSCQRMFDRFGDQISQDVRHADSNSRAMLAAVVEGLPA